MLSLSSRLVSRNFKSKFWFHYLLTWEKWIRCFRIKKLNWLKKTTKLCFCYSSLYIIYISLTYKFVYVVIFIFSNCDENNKLNFRFKRFKSDSDFDKNDFFSLHMRMKIKEKSYQNSNFPIHIIIRQSSYIYYLCFKNNIQIWCNCFGEYTLFSCKKLNTKNLKINVEFDSNNFIFTQWFKVC